MIVDPSEAAAQALRIAENGGIIARDGTKIPVSAQTICIHGDTPGAVRIAAAVAEHLKTAGVALRPLAAAPAGLATRISKPTYEKLRLQAALQVKGEHATPPLYELLPPTGADHPISTATSVPAKAGASAKK